MPANDHVDQGQGLTRNFTRGVLYAVIQLDDVLHRAGEMLTTELVHRQTAGST